MPVTEQLDLGRDAFARRDWEAACSLLTAVDEGAGLPVGDLERLATATYLLGDEQRALGLLGRAHRAATEAGDREAAARSAFWVAYHLFNGGELAQAGGWLERGRRLLDGLDGTTPLPGYFLGLEAARLASSGRPAEALPLFGRALALGARLGDPDLRTLGCLGEGQALVQLGEPEAGMARLDEVMVAVTTGEVSPVVSGLAYCLVIATCARSFDYVRAGEWTTALAQWCDTQPSAVPFRGYCLVHRSELLAMRGQWRPALAEAEQARLALGRRRNGAGQGWACYQQGEVQRLLGELDEAEDLYRRAGAAGHETQPGLALLRLAQGDAAAAAAGVRRALDETSAPLDRPRLLAAQSEIALSARDVDTARTAADELASIVTGTRLPFLTALAAQTTAAVAAAEGDPATARAEGRRAWRLWQQLDAPYEAARSRVLVGLASRALGDRDAARIELDAARETFERLRARRELRLLDKYGEHPASGNLSPREVEVLRLVATGRSNRDIASALVLSEKTVARHLANIFTKIEVSSRAGATAYAFQNHLV